MMDDRFDDFVQEAARDYNAPPDPPREVMWARIEAVRRERAQRRSQLRLVYSPWTRWGLGLAAALAIGIGIGRFTIREQPGVGALTVAPEAAATTAARPPQDLAHRIAVTEHLTRAEMFLTSLPVPSEAGDASIPFWSNAAGLLASTRLLLDSPAVQDPVFRSLLEDLELVLVQIVQLSDDGGTTELQLLTEGLERRGLLPRLRTAIPAGLPLGMEGA